MEPEIKEITLANNNSTVALTVDLDTGVYRVTAFGRDFTGTGIIAARPADEMLFNISPGGTPSGDIELTGHSIEADDDSKSVTLNWNARGLRFDTTFMLPSDENTVEFTHSFPDGFTTSSIGAFGDTALNFPVFVSDCAGGDSLSLFSYRYELWPYPVFGRGLRGTLAAWNDKDIRTPLLIFDDSGTCAALCPMNDFMIRATRVMHRGGGLEPAIATGLNGELARLDPGHESKTVLVFSESGVNGAMELLGKKLMSRSGKKPADPRGSTAVGTLGYWTDNGAYYYYRAEPGKNYETALLEMKDYLDSEGIRVGYFQLDSWWYHRAEVLGGLILWEPLDVYFPDGIDTFSEKLGLPIATHNKFFAKNNKYRERFEFIDGSGGAHPAGRGVFDEFADNLASWGGIMYEQDWLATQVDNVEALRSDPALAAQWMDNLTGAMARRGIEVQFCMPSIAFYLQSTLHPNVTNIRASDDYQHRLAGDSHQLWWEFFYMSALAAPLGLLPFKDVFITHPASDADPERMPPEEDQVATGQWHDEPVPLYEPYFTQNAIISILSAGPVGIGDRTGTINKEIVGMICDEDGVLVKPDFPMVPTESMYSRDPKTGPVSLTGSTFTDHGGLRWHYIFAINANRDRAGVEFSITPGDLSLSGDYVFYDFRRGKASGFNAGIKTGLPGYADYEYLIAAPAGPGGHALIGDAGKFAAASRERFLDVRYTDDTITATLNGPEGTTTRLLVYSRTAPRRVCIEPSGDAAAVNAAGENLYEIVVAGGAGKIIRIEFQSEERHG